MRKLKITTISFVGLFVALTAVAFAYTMFIQGFEVDTSDILDIDDAWYGQVTRVASGTNGVASFDGGWHSIIEGDASSGPFTRFDGYRDTWTGTWIAEASVYLDPSWADGTGFDYSVAANGSDGNHQRDYIFHVTKDTSSGDLMVAGSNNTNFAPREDLETINHYVVSEAAWYTLQHVFYDNGGSLAVDLNLLDSASNVLFTETRHTVTDTIPAEVGGNRYGWFTFINVVDGMAVDNILLRNNEPYPRNAEITSPLENEEVIGMLSLEAYLDDEHMDDSVQWAVRAGTCAAGTGTVLGNVDGFSDPYDWDGEYFSAEADLTSWDPGDYCFVFNPTESEGDLPIRLTREFSIPAKELVASVNGGGHALEEMEGKKKNWLDVSFGGEVMDYGVYGYEGQWQVVLHNVNADLDKSKFHGTEVTQALWYDGDSSTCDDAVRFDMLGSFNGEDGYKMIFRAGDLGSPNKADTVRVEIFDPSGSRIYDTHWGSEFTDESSCVGSARTGLDNGNLTIKR